MGSKIVSMFACLCFTLIFFVDALIFNTYIGNTSTSEILSTQPSQNEDVPPLTDENLQKLPDLSLYDYLMA